MWFQWNEKKKSTQIPEVKESRKVKTQISKSFANCLFSYKFINALFIKKRLFFYFVYA